MLETTRKRKIKEGKNTILKITYRPGAKPIRLELDTKGKSIREIAKDAAQQLTKNYTAWKEKSGYPISKKESKRYEIGQEYMILEKLEEVI